MFFEVVHALPPEKASPFKLIRPYPESYFAFDKEEEENYSESSSTVMFFIFY